MLWKQFAGRCIYDAGTGVQVYQNLLYRWLKFNSRAIQSMISRFKPERPALNYLKPFIYSVQIEPGSCCMLGLGGGGVVHALKPELSKNTITVYESNAEVIEIAQRYFKIKSHPNLTIVNDNAHTLSESPQRFKHILIDIYSATTFPKDCINEDFFKTCQQAMEDQGYLIVNLANRSNQPIILGIMRKLFNRSTLIIPVPKSQNIIIVARLNCSVRSYAEYLIETKRIRSVYWEPDWGFIARV